MGEFRLPDTIRKKVVSDFRTLSQTFGYQVTNYNIPEFWKITQGEGIRVAMLDTGTDLSHQDLQGAFVASFNASSTNKSARKSGKIKSVKKIKDLSADVTDGDGHGCVSPDTLIHTNFCGIEKISDLYNKFDVPEIKCQNSHIKDISNLGVKTYSLDENGKSVISHITHLHKTCVNGLINHIYLTGNIDFKLTPWHPISTFTCDSHGKINILKKRADMLKAGDRVIFGSREKAGQLVTEYYRGIGSKYRQCLNCGHILNSYKKRLSKYPFLCHKCHKNKWIELNREYLITEDLAYLIGMIMTDGYVHDRNIRIESSTPEILKKCWNISQKLGFGGTIKTLSDRYGQLTIKSKNLVDLSIGLGILRYKKSYYQELPEFVGKSPCSVVCSFLAGVIDGDGCISKSNNKNRITTVSKNLAYQISALMNSMGIHCGIQKSKNIYKNKENKEFPLLNCTFSCLPDEIINNIAHPIKKQRSFKKIRCQRHATRIISVEQENYNGYFYDFTVDAYSHTYIANGHFVSNTATTGIVGARNNSIGVVGIAPLCSIIPIKVLDDDGTGSFDNIIRGLYKAIELKADVINMSLGSPAGSPQLYQAIKDVYKAGIPMICAAGNSGIKMLDFPARYTETISVGAIDKNNVRASFSQMGETLDFVAPGVDIISTVPNNRYQSMSGSSMSAPWVTGVIALLLAKHRLSIGKTPINNVEDVREHLRKTCIDLGTPGRNSQTGWGLIDVRKWMVEEASILSRKEYVDVLKSRITRLETLLYKTP